MMHQECGISVSEMNSLYVVLVSANTMKPYFIGITRTHSKVLYAVTWMTSFGGGSQLFKNEVICGVFKKFQIQR